MKKAPFDPIELDLNGVVRETVDFLSALAIARQIELTSLTTQIALPILGDRIQLQQVVLNLVMNGIEAMKDTPPEHRSISIRSSRVEKFAELSVAHLGRKSRSRRREVPDQASHCRLTQNGSRAPKAWSTLSIRRRCRRS